MGDHHRHGSSQVGRVCCCCCATVKTGSVGIVEKCGKYTDIAHPGCHWLCCCFGTTMAGFVSMRMRDLLVQTSTKTRDDVFVDIKVSVQYQVVEERVQEAFYKLTDVNKQMEAYVYDVIRSEVPQMSLDELFLSKEKIAEQVKLELGTIMRGFGYSIFATPVTDIEPDAKVKAAMNEKNKNLRLRDAAADAGEADKIKLIKKAEGDARQVEIAAAAEAQRITVTAQAEAEAKFLQGQGLARQRVAIMGGLSDACNQFIGALGEKRAVSIREVLDLQLMNQYFDTLREMSKDGKGHTVFFPSNPGGMADVASQVRNGLLQANAPGAATMQR
eukprot:gnl/Spiro4/10424_TR5576_c0_g1_i1.p1 gnl/Spiro4/10424_TR5576_c0_g1~~gnl/Spiro4/10424_TR5576_c0_g1_i1.p1  ORF type:complete len:340 (+),score=123.39 gnl/Spiro4/10424_TR5576_c0_g1_i1:33-1022(+)